MSADNSYCSLVVALKYCSNQGGTSSIPRHFFTVRIPPNLSLNVFGESNLTVYFVKGIFHHCETF